MVKLTIFEEIEKGSKVCKRGYEIIHVMSP
jgi:hypothetical protein